MIIEWGCFRDSWNGIKTATPPFFDSKKVGHLEKTVLPFGGRPELPAASAWCQAPSRSHPGAIISHHFSQPWSTISYIKVIYNVIYKDIMSYIYTIQPTIYNKCLHHFTTSHAQNTTLPDPDAKGAPNARGVHRLSGFEAAMVAMVILIR